MDEWRIPAVYRPGYEQARADDRDLAENYVRHTLIGDPEADAVVEALAEFGQRRRIDSSTPEWSGKKTFCGKPLRS